MSDINWRRFLRTSRGIVNATLLAIGGLAYAALTPSAALTATVTETTLHSHTFAANELSAGAVVDFEFQGIATATNSTDTLEIQVKLGTTVIVTTGAIDVANNDIWTVRGRIVVRTDGSGGTMVATGVQVLGAEGTAPKNWKLAETALNTTGGKALTVKGTWSTNNAGNSCRNDIAIVRLEG